MSAQEGISLIESNKGKYNVGIKFYEEIDYSRTFANESYRNISSIIWYPSEDISSKNKVTFDEFITYNPSRIYFSKSDWNVFFNSFGSDVDLSKLNNKFSFSQHQIKPSPENFPTVVYAPGADGESFENSLICELIASHGFIVISTESLGYSSYRIKSNPLNLEGQARDIEFAMSIVKEKFPNAVLNKTNLIGFSWGGLASILVQVRNNNVKSVVSLDGSIALYRENFEKTAFYNLQNIRVPYLLLSANKTYDRLKPFYDDLKYSDVTLVNFKHLTQVDFMGLTYLSRFFSSKELDDIEMNKRKSFEEIIKMTVRFIKSVNDSESESITGTIKNSQDNSLFEFQFKKSLPKPPSTQEFLKMFRTYSKDSIVKVYDGIINNDKDYKLFEPFDAIDYAYELYYDFEFKNQATVLLEISKRLHPNFYMTYGHLGSLYEKLKNYEEANTNFKKALQMVNNKDIINQDDALNIKWYKKRIVKLKEKMKN